MVKYSMCVYVYKYRELSRNPLNIIIDVTSLCVCSGHSVT